MTRIPNKQAVFHGKGEPYLRSTKDLANLEVLLLEQIRPTVEVGSLSQSFTRFFTSQVVSRISSTNFMFGCLGVGFPYISCVHTGKKGEGSSVSEIFGDKESPSSQCRKDFPNIRGIA